MAKRVGKYTIELENNPKIKSFAAVVGKKEGEGPLAKHFDKIFENTTLQEKSWEKAESMLQTKAVKLALEKANLKASNVNFMFAGDLLNQCSSSTYGLRSLDIPFLGQYGACSTMAQTLLISSMVVEAGVAQNCVAVTSSHYCAAEKQFRLPLEYGGQRPPTAQWTVTGSGAMIISENTENNLFSKPFVKHITVGRMLDMGIKDETNMGAAMAPAAVQTLCDFFSDTKTTPNDYDLILTGDLGEVGSVILKKLAKTEGYEIGGNYNDCGLMIYNREAQDVHAGGSGCGCSGSVLCSVILKRMLNHELKNIIFMATGALMSPTISQQGETIPGIAHLVNIRI